MIGPLFWKVLTVICLAWYGSVTIYVAVRGAADIREMLRNLARRDHGEPPGTDRP